MTALTDLALFLLALALALGVRRLRGPENRDAVSTWTCVLGLLAVASLLGAIAHGFAMSDHMRWLVWQPLNLSLGLAMSLFVAAAILDLAGPIAARKTVPMLLGTGILFYALTLLFPETFMTFIAYEGLAMLFSLGTYAWLAARRARAGAGWMVAGLLVTMVASVVQATGTAGTAIVGAFDNNGVFHLIQMPGLVMIALGVRQALTRHSAMAAAPEPE